MKLIVFEGIDFSGKTTLANMLRDYILTNTKFSCVVLSETQHTLIGKKFLKEFSKLSSLQKIELISQAREECLEKAKKYDIAIFDRYYFSTIVYQLEQCLDHPQLLTKIMKNFSHFHHPDIVFYLDITYDTYKERFNLRYEKHELDIITEKEFLKRRLLYHSTIISTIGNKITKAVIIDSNRSLNSVFEDIVEIYKYPIKYFLQSME